MRYNFTILLVFAGLLCSTLGHGQEMEVSQRSLSQTYKVDKGCYVEISNKYGDIEISNWDKDSVQIDVLIRAISEKNSWRNEMIEYIGVDFAATSGFVIAETTWKEEAGFWRKNSYNMTKELGTNRIEVNYVVHLPKYIPLEIENRFGNIFMGSHDGELEIELHHGDFRARNLKNLEKLEIRYGKAKINRIEKGEINLNSGSTLDLDEAGELMLTSATSEVEIGNVDVLNIASRHDGLSLDNAGLVNGTFSLSDLRINELRNSLKADCKFGTVRIQAIAETVGSIDIKGNKTDVIINVPTDFAGRFQLNVDEEENLSYPKDLFVVSKKVGEDKRLQFSGSMGTHAGTQITVNTTSGYIEIKE